MRVAAVAVALLLAGCGGGSSSDDEPYYYDVDFELLGFSLAEATFLVGRYTADAFVASEANNLADREDACTDSGSRLLRFTDWDSSGGVTADDEVQVDYTNCNDPLFGGTLNGGFTLTVLGIAPADSDGRRNVYFTVTFNGFRVTELGFDTWVRGSYQLDFSSVNNVSDSVRLTLANGNFGYDATSGETVRFASGAEFQYDSDFQAGTYRFQFYADVTITSSARVIPFRMDTLGNIPDQLGEFVGHFADYPTDGAARFYNRYVGSDCLLTPGSDGDGYATPEALMRQSADDEYCMLGDGAGKRFWYRIIDGIMFADNDSFNLRDGGTPGPF